MRLEPDRLTFGVAPKILKDCARQLRNFESFSLDDFCLAIGVPADEAKPVLDALVRNAFFSKRRRSSGTVYIPTTKLNQLALASISRGLPRDKAAELLSRIVEQAKRINTHPDEFGYQIIRIAVFGSFLGDEPLLGDLDVAAKYSELPGLVEKAKLERGMSILELVRNDPYLRKTISFLKAPNQRQISLHEWDDLAKIGTPFRIVYES